MKPTPEQVKAARHAKHMTQVEAAAAVGVTERAWRFWETGERAISAPAWKLFQTIKPRKRREK